MPKRGCICFRNGCISGKYYIELKENYVLLMKSLFVYYLEYRVLYLVKVISNYTSETLNKINIISPPT